VSLPRTATVIWGSASILWETVVKANSKLNHVWGSFYINGNKVELEEEMLHSMYLFRKNILWILATRSGSQRLAECLWNYRSRDATNPRDKVLGILGLYPAWFQDKEDPNYYDMDLVSMYEYTTHRLIEMDDGLMSLISTEPQSEFSNKPNLASWAVDWEAWEWTAIHPYGSRLIRYDHFNADGGLTLRYESDPADHTIRLNGCFADIIVTVGKPLTSHPDGNLTPEDEMRFRNVKLWREKGNGAIAWPTPSDESRLASIKGWYELYRQHQDQLSNNEATNEAKWREYFWRTLTGNMMIDGIASMPHREANLEDGKRFDGYLQGDKEAAGCMRNSIHDHINGRSFFITEKGFMGIGSPSVNAGDEVWVLFGGRVPFVLRRLKEEPSSVQDEGVHKGLNFLSIGDCYVHGIMNGEAVLESQVHTQTVALH
jgi:hypothetical protein